MSSRHICRSLSAPRIRDFRRALNLKQGEFGRLVDTGQGWVSRWENPRETKPKNFVVVQEKVVAIPNLLSGSLTQLAKVYKGVTLETGPARWKNGSLVHGDPVFRVPHRHSPLAWERDKLEEWVAAIFDTSISEEQWEARKQSSLWFLSNSPLQVSKLIEEYEELKGRYPGLRRDCVVYTNPDIAHIQSDLEVHGKPFVEKFCQVLKNESEAAHARIGDSEGPGYALLRGTLLEMLKAHPEIRQVRTSEGPANLEELSFTDFPKMLFNDWLPEEWEEAPLPCLAAMDFFTLALALSIDESGAIRKSSLEVLKKSAANWSRLRRENEDWKPTGNPGRRFMDLWEGLEAASNG